jgi:lipoprotein NlpD
MRLTSSIRIAIVCTTLGLLAACSTPKQRAPVEDRGAVRNPSVGAVAAGPAAAAPAPEAAKPLPGAENAGKPGYFTVKPGDTMIRIGLESGQNWRDIARWNGIDNPNTLEVGQVLRVLPPGVDPNAPATKAVTASRVEPRPLDAKPSPAAASGAASAAAPVVAAAPSASATAPAVTREPDEDIAWGWPSGSAVATPFDETRTKGLVFAGKAGDPVFAAADGRVVYAGSGLRGYGNLVIVKHNGTYLSAYAHNQALLVKEDQVVRRGQRIAEMGSSDAERVQLHFEIRRLGKPVDPTRLLPAR